MEKYVNFHLNKQKYYILVNSFFRNSIGLGINRFYIQKLLYIYVHLKTFQKNCNSDNYTVW